MDLYIFDHAAFFYLSIWRFDKSEFVDPCKARQRRDEADVRAFRRLDRANASIVCRVHVANLESGTFSREAARPESRQASFVRDLRKRIRLVHELRKLRRPEKLADRSRHRLCIDKIARHRGKHVLLNGHLFLDRPLHAFEADAELILKQFANGANAPVAEMIDIVRAENVRCPSSCGEGN